MTDLSWLAHEARAIHQYFEQLFFILLGFFIVIGVVVEYFKLPLGITPSFGTIIGRCLIATVLLITFPEVIDLLSQLSDSLARKLGDPNQFNLVREKMGEKLSEFSWSWVKIKESITVALCYVCFVLFHFSIYVADAFFLYTWTLLYIFSPVLIALFVLPATASATTALYRSLIEISCWKPVWMVTATILWSAALSGLNKPAAQVSFLSVICYCLILTGSLLLTPFVVHALSQSGLTTLARNIGFVTVGATVIGPKQVLKIGGDVGKRVYNSGLSGVSLATRRHFPKMNQAIQKMPRFQVPKRNVFVKPPNSKTKTRYKT